MINDNDMQNRWRKRLQSLELFSNLNFKWLGSRTIHRLRMNYYISYAFIDLNLIFRHRFVCFRPCEILRNCFDAPQIKSWVAASPPVRKNEPKYAVAISISNLHLIPFWPYDCLQFGWRKFCRFVDIDLFPIAKCLNCFIIRLLFAA